MDVCTKLHKFSIFFLFPLLLILLPKSKERIPFLVFSFSSASHSPFLRPKSDPNIRRFLPFAGAWRLEAWKRSIGSISSCSQWLKLLSSVFNAIQKLEDKIQTIRLY